MRVDVVPLQCPYFFIKEFLFDPLPFLTHEILFSSLSTGICLYYSDDFELKGVYDYFFEAQKELKEADLWFKKIKEMRESINKIKDNFDKNRKKDAIQVASKALKIDPSHKKFNFNILNKRAALNKLCDWQERAIEDLTQAELHRRFFEQY